MQRKVLITGAAGFIGANLVRKLIDNNCLVFALVRTNTNLWRLKEVKKKINFAITPLSNVQKLKKTIKRINPSLIIHLAAFGNTHTETDVIDMINTNLINTVNLILASDEINYDCFIYTGSSSEYGYKTKPMTESDILKPNSFYSATKASATAFCTMYAQSRKKPIVTVRPFSVYGPYEENNRLIPVVVNNFINNKPIRLTDNHARRDFIFIDDLTDGYFKLLRKINKPIYGEIFNFGTGKQYSNRNIVMAMSSIMKVGPKIIIDKSQNRAWDSHYWAADIKKSFRLLQWKPKHTLIQGLKKTLRWYLNYDQRSKNYT